MKWTNEDAVSLRDYLATASGKNLIKNLIETYIELGGKNFEEGALIARERKGEEDTVKRILDAAAFEEKPDPDLNTYVNVNDSPR